MAASGPNYSIPDLERLLDEKKSHLEYLVHRREELQREIDALDQQMHNAATLKGSTVRRKRRRNSNPSPLRSVVLDILKKNKKGLTLPELTAKVIETGYKSHSSNFQNVVYQCLYNTAVIEHDGITGCYRLRKE